jgi:putative tryptophan/tyrosine transport system permease protein
MTLMLGAWTIGLILSLLAIGVFISFRIFSFPDITTEGSLTTGAAITATLLVAEVDPFTATFAGFCGGALAGALTGILHTKFQIHGLLAGILVMTALYSINLHIMGKSNVPLLTATTLATYAERVGTSVFGGASSFMLAGWKITTRDALVLLMSLVVISIVGTLLYFFFRTNLGTAMRATGDNDQMIRALGVNVGNMIILGLALANGLIGLAGALFVQYQGFADAQMGIGMVVWGLASVIIGEALIGTSSLGLTIVATVMGSVLFRLLVAIALRAGLNPNDLKLITALFVFFALVLPTLLATMKKRAGGVSHA